MHLRLAFLLVLGLLVIYLYLFLCLYGLLSFVLVGTLHCLDVFYGVVLFWMIVYSIWRIWI